MIALRCDSVVSAAGNTRIARLSLETLGLVAVAALSGTALSQASSETDRVDDKDRIAEEMLAAQAKEGPRSAALIELFKELGVLYETEGRYELATAALEQARQLVRANYGLHTLDQVPLLQQAMANQQAASNFAMVRALEEELLDLAGRHPDDVRSAAIYRDAGRRRMEVLRRFVAGEAPGEVYPEAGVYSFWRDDMIRDLAADAQIHYADAAAVMLRNRRYASDELRDSEMEIVRASDVIRRLARPLRWNSTMAGAQATMQQNTFSSVSRNRLNRNQEERRLHNPALQERMNTLTELANRAAVPDAPGAAQDFAGNLRGDGIVSPYQLGRDSYARVIAYDELVLGDSADAASLRNRLEAYLQLADWDLLYSQNGVAFDQYARVHELLESTPIGEPLIAEIFAPSLPIVLPVFSQSPLATLESPRYIDVSFEITKFGESRRVEIVGAAPDVSDAARDELLSLVKSARFRPRVTDGELGRAAPVVVRYYLN
jgi:hypothetical protein